MAASIEVRARGEVVRDSGAPSGAGDDGRLVRPVAFVVDPLLHAPELFEGRLAVPGGVLVVEDFRNILASGMLFRMAASFFASLSSLQRYVCTRSPLSVCLQARLSRALGPLTPGSGQKSPRKSSAGS